MVRRSNLLNLVISAIKNLRKFKGCTSQEILQYISLVYNISPTVARHQVRSVLERGVTYGILRETGGKYNLLTVDEVARQEVAAQEIGMLDSYRRRRVHRSRGGEAWRNRDSDRGRRGVRRCRRDDRRRSRGCGSRFCGKSGRSGGGFGKRVRDETTGPTIEPTTDVDKLTDKSTGSNRATTGDSVIGGIERGNHSSMPPEQWDRGIPLSC
ncbi:hypothetical protein PUN28_001350 [Cardiocondyla obscurior]|uniref:H15 domain-containing protein n=1 Tax=Cardiocondyla obscurior TaxID=286306 RepID=A0AAW2H512_9HYME